MSEVTRNEAAGRYELIEDGVVAFADYEKRGGAVIFPHTVVPKALGGRGIGSRLIKAALADVRAQELKVVPICSFVAAYIDKHAEEQDLLAADSPG